MSAAPIYLATRAPRLTSDETKLLTKFEPIADRLEDPKFAKNLITYLLDMDEGIIFDWSGGMDDEKATEVIKDFELKPTGDLSLQEIVGEAVEAGLDEMEADSELSPILALMGKEILSRAIKSLCEVDAKGNVDWDGDFGTAYPTGVLLFVTGGMSWGDSPSDSFDDLLLIVESEIFEEPFTE